MVDMYKLKMDCGAYTGGAGVTWVCTCTLGELCVGSTVAQSGERSPCKRRVPGSSPGLAASVLLQFGAMTTRCTTYIVDAPWFVRPEVRHPIYFPMGSF